MPFKKTHYSDASSFIEIGSARSLSLRDPETEDRAHRQTFCVAGEDLMHVIRDKNTGTFYDVRDEANVTVLEQETRRLTILPRTDGRNPWAEDEKERSRRGRRLLVACENGDFKAAADLLDVGRHGDLTANVNLKGLDHYTPLHLATSEGHSAVVQLLIESKANVNALSRSLRTPLHLACERGFIEIMEMLLANQAEVNVQDSSGNTPLHYLALGGLEEGLKILLEWGANASVRNMYGETAIELAKDLRIRELLVERSKGKEEMKERYSRTVMENLILHNNRADTIKLILFKAEYMSLTNMLNGLPAEESKVYNCFNKVHSKSRRAKIIEAARKFASIKLEPALSTEKIGLSSFDIVNVLGKGSFAKVYLVRHKATNKLFAMKAISKEKVFKCRILRYIKAEQSILCSVRHPFIVRIEAAFQNAKKLFMLLQYCPGYSLHSNNRGDVNELLVAKGHLSEEVARLYASEILLALEELHKRNIIFRDLKPANVLFDEDGHALLTDFGLSKEGMMEDNFTSSFCGTVAYLAPEVLDRKHYNKAVDWYLFGVFLYELLIGRPPFYSHNKYSSR